MGAYDYEKNLISAWDMSSVNPPDVGWRGLGNDGVGTGLVAATDIVDGIGGMATEFDGTEHVTVDGLHAWPAGRSAMSLCCWIRFTAGQTNKGLIGWWFVSNNRLSIGNASSITWTIGTTVVTSPLAYNDGSWHHLIGSYDAALAANNLKLFIDGSLIGTANRTALIVTADAFTIAASQGGGSRLSGSIDDARLYDEGFTALEANDLYRRSRRGAT